MGPKGAEAKEGCGDDGEEVANLTTEYGTANKITTKGDVYSYGILLLEMFTGKRPTDDAFVNGMNLRRYVEMASPERVINIIDTLLLSGDISGANDDTRFLKCVGSILKIGLSCSNPLPSRRPEMKDVIDPLRVLRDAYAYA